MVQRIMTVGSDMVQRIMTLSIDGFHWFRLVLAPFARQPHLLCQTPMITTGFRPSHARRNEHFGHLLVGFDASTYVQADIA